MSDTSGEFRPTAQMVANARLGLRLRERFGRGGTEVGVRRARQLSERRPLTSADTESMYGHFARHEVDKNTTRHRWGSVDETPTRLRRVAPVGRRRGK